MRRGVEEMRRMWEISFSKLCTQGSCAMLRTASGGGRSPFTQVRKPKSLATMTLFVCSGNSELRVR